MSEQIKFIVQELNKQPFSKNLNLINFDNLDSIQLLQILTDVLNILHGRPQLDVREEGADQTAIRIFTDLRVLKYKPPASDANSLSNFRQGIVQGEKHVVCPILEWLLKNYQELKKRAYLAQFLVMVDVPPDFMADGQVADLSAQHEQFIEEFKSLHKQLDDTRSSGFNTAEIKKDIASMEDERDQLIKRVERLKKKVETSPNSEVMLQAAKNLHVEKNRAEKLQKQKQEQNQLIMQCGHRMHRLQQQLKDMKQAILGMTPEALFQRLEEEVKVNDYMVRDKLPKEVEGKRKALKEIQTVVNEPAMGQNDLATIQQQIKITTAELNQLIEKRMMSKEGAEDKQAVFRNQAAIIGRKKETAAEKLFALREEFNRLQSENAEKQQMIQQASGGEAPILRGEDFTKYANRLRSMNVEYKAKRQELSTLKAEAGVLARTEEILTHRADVVKAYVSKVEAKKGVSGFNDTQEALESVSHKKSETDQAKGVALEDMSRIVTKLNKRIAESKESLAPLIAAVKPLRAEAETIQTEHAKRKSQYDTLVAGLESNRAKLEQEVRALRDEIASEESRYQYVKAMTRFQAIQQEKINEEMKSYTSSDSEAKRRSLREQYAKRIQEQENLGKNLRDKQKHLRDNQVDSTKHLKMWRDFERIMECKMKLAERRGGMREREPVREVSAPRGGKRGQQADTLAF
jgi:intraflagellar transport protein 81